MAVNREMLQAQLAVIEAQIALVTMQKDQQLEKLTAPQASLTAAIEAATPPAQPEN